MGIERAYISLMPYVKVWFSLSVMSQQNKLECLSPTFFQASPFRGGLICTCKFKTIPKTWNTLAYFATMAVKKKRF